MHECESVCQCHKESHVPRIRDRENCRVRAPILVSRRLGFCRGEFQLIYSCISEAESLLKAHLNAAAEDKERTAALVGTKATIDLAHVKLIPEQGSEL